MSDRTTMMIRVETQLFLMLAFGVIVSGIIGLLTRKALNPAYEEVIEDRITGVSRLAAGAITVYFLWPVVILFLFPAGGLTAALGYGAVVAGVFVACSYRITNATLVTRESVPSVALRNPFQRVSKKARRAEHAE